MAYWLENYIFCFVLSTILAGFIIPKILLIAFRRRLFDDVDERKIHRGSVPRLGGIAFFPSLIFSFCVVTGFSLRFSYAEMGPALHDVIVPVLFLLCALILMYVTGIADDLVGVRYRAKFLLQIGGAALIVMSGTWVGDLFGFVGIFKMPVWVGILFTGFFVVYVINALNLIDGIDGLATGLSAIALIFFSYVFISSGQYVYAMLTAAALGTLVPFFYYNVFGKAETHTKIFMGDTGSLTMGTILAFLSITVTCIPRADLHSNFNPSVLAIAPLMLPCLDVMRVFFHRMKRRKNPFLPDRCHIHHKLLALGLRQSVALVIILFADAALIMLNIVASPYLSCTLILLLDLVLWIVLNMLLTKLIRIRERKTGTKLYD